MDTPKTWLVTGASRGLGACLVRHLLERGQNVVATARRFEAVTAAHPASDQLLAVPLDVTDEEQAHTAVEQAVMRFGGLDVLVNNAGSGLIGPIEECSGADVRRLFETNVFGMLSVLRAALPVLRSQRSGRIINVGSVSGLRGAPANGIYSGTKHAIEGITEALRLEVAHLGIEVMVVQPGFTRTGFLAPDVITYAAGHLTDYDDGPSTAVVDLTRRSHNQQGGDPDKMVDIVVDVALAEGRLPPHLPLGADAVEIFESRRPASFIEPYAPWRERAISCAYGDGALSPSNF